MPRTRSSMLLWPAAAALSLLVTGCATGFNAETNQSYTAADGTNEFSADVDVLNALFVMNPTISGTTASATMSTVLLDSTAPGDTLVGVEVTSDDGEVEATLSEPVELPTNVSTTIGDEPEIVLKGEIKPGQFLNTTLTFERAGAVEFPAITVDRQGPYERVAVPEAD